MNTFYQTFNTYYHIFHAFMNSGFTNIVVSALGIGWAPSNPWKCLMRAKGIPTSFKFKYEPWTAVRKGEKLSHLVGVLSYTIYHPSRCHCRLIQGCQWGPRTHFTNGLWAHEWNFVKMLFALIMISINLSGHKFVHHDSWAVTKCELSWNMQICDLMCFSYERKKEILQELDYELIKCLWNVRQTTSLSQGGHCGGTEI